MSNQLKRKKPLLPQLVELTSELLLSASGRFDGLDGLEAEAVHDVRKGLKRSRATLRLCRSALAHLPVAELDHQLRDLGRQLSRWRDADSLDEAAQRLASPLRADMTDTLLVVRSRVARRRDELRQRLGSEGIMARRSVLKGLNDARAELARWPLPNAATRDVADDLKVGFRVARKALGEAREEPTTENLHELRKRVKRLGYNAQLLGKAWAELTPLARRDLDDLADRLGQEHDLGLLDAFVAREPETWPPDCDIATLRSAIAQRRAELVTESFGLARQTLKRKLRPRRSRRVLKRLFPVKLPLAVVPDDRQRQHS